MNKWRNLTAKEKALSILQTIFVCICVVIAIFPIGWVIMSSFKSNAEILSNGISLPTHFSFQGYIDAFKISPILKYFINSVIVATTATAGNLIFVSMAAYVFARVRFRGKNVIYSLLLTSLVIPLTALLNSVYIVISSMGLYDKKMGLILVYIALNLPVTLLIMRATFASIPKSIEEASYVDGASFARTFFQIMLPCAKGGLVSAGIVAFLNNWNEFTFALVLTSGESARTLPLSLSYFTAQFSFNYTAMFAAVTIAVIPSILVFAIFQEQVVSSLTAGSVKE